VLGVDRSATENEIKKRYRVLALRYHPDKQETHDEEMFKLVNEANAVLCDPDKRREYDEYGSRDYDSTSEKKIRKAVEMVLSFGVTGFYGLCYPLKTLSVLSKAAPRTVSVRSLGWRALFNGGWASFLFWYIPDTVANFISPKVDELRINISLSYIAARFLGLLIGFPFLVASTCLQSGFANGIIDCFQKVIQHGGVRSLWTASIIYILKVFVLDLTLIQVENAMEWIKETIAERKELTNTTKGIITVMEITTKSGVYAFFLSNPDCHCDISS